MKEKIFRNFSLKILSALCAIVLWTIIVNIYDPTMGVTISTVPVQLINTESLTDKGYTYEITDGSKISVYVSGPKSVITDIKAADIVATADLSRITAFADYADIDVKVVKDGKTLTNVEVTPKTTAVKLDIENRVTQQFDVGMEVNGTEAEGYVVTKQSVSPSTIKITGSSTTIAKIAQVKAICDISNAQDNIQSVVPIVLYDTDGNVIDDPQLELSKSEVEYTASVKKSKTVPLKYSVSGEPADGYSVHKVQSSADQITISGETKVLDQITQITIPSDQLKVTGLSSDKTFRLWMEDFVPSDVSVVSDSVVSITVKISDVHSREFTVKTSDITFSGLSSGLEAAITDQDTIHVILTGSDEALAAAQASDIKATVNLTGLKEGTYTLSIQFQLPGGCSLDDTYKAAVKIQAQAAQTQPETTTQQTQETTTAGTSETTGQNRQNKKLKTADGREKMVSEKIVVGSALGIHLRPAGAMCDAAVKYDSHITFAYGEGKTANAKSVISILAAGIKCGDEIELIADGPDEQEALENVAAAFKESLKD